MLMDAVDRLSEYAHDKDAECRVLSALMFIGGEVAENVLTRLDSQDFWIWPHDLLFSRFRESWKDDKFNTGRQVVNSLLGVADDHVLSRVLYKIEEAFEWPLRWMWEDDCQLLRTLRKRRGEQYVASAALSSALDGKRYDGEFARKVLPLLDHLSTLGDF